MTSPAQVIIAAIEMSGWDTAQETGYPLFPGPEILDEPDQAVFITVSGGTGYVTEEAAADSWTFQARLRGPQNEPDAALNAAAQLDALILWMASQRFAPYGTAILTAGRTGGPPAQLPLDPEDRRFQTTCNYMAVTGSAIYQGA